MTAAATRSDRFFKSAVTNHLDFRETSGRNEPDGTSLENSTIWITWEKQRRTTGLAEALKIQLFQILCDGPRAMRYLVLSAVTIRLLASRRPRILIVQNPSIALALLASIARRLYGYRLVVDRHTNFMMDREPTLVVRLFRAISDITLRGADLTIVTNGFLKRYVEQRGGRGFVLPDRLPAAPDVAPAELGGGRHVCFICTFADDEPYDAFIRSAGLLAEDIRLHVTGSAKNARFSDEAVEVISESGRVVLTGFLPETDYWALLRGVDAVIDLTTLDHCLVCGAYEAIALGKPMILSDADANRELFGEAPVLVSPSAESIAAGITEALEDLPGRERMVMQLREEFRENWDRVFGDLRASMTRMLN